MASKGFDILFFTTAYWLLFPVKVWKFNNAYSRLNTICSRASYPLLEGTGEEEEVLLKAQH